MGLKTLRFHAVDDTSAPTPASSSENPSHRGIRGPRAAASVEDIPAFHTEEAAARFYLDRLLGADRSPRVRGLRAPSRPEVVPDFEVDRQVRSPLSGTRLVRFRQQHASIPVFGSQAIVELDKDLRLVSTDAEVDDLRDVAAETTIDIPRARSALERHLGMEAGALHHAGAPTLCYFPDEQKGLRLSWLFEKVPAAPPAVRKRLAHQKCDGHRLGSSPRRRHFRFDFLIDAADAEVLFSYSRSPLLGKDVPVKLVGTDEDGQRREIRGRRKGERKYELWDTFGRLRTFDKKGADIDGTFPTSPATSSTARLPESMKAAVSAHAHAGHVCDFYRLVLKRDGIDGKGGEVISVVNCTSKADDRPPEWRNAVWYENQMWYGQQHGGKGLLSFARYLDVVAHELTHGVTEATSALVYRDQSGALNESFSDIFAIFVKNWSPKAGFRDVFEWSWEIGSGLGNTPDLPLRDMKDPARTGDPGHVREYKPKNKDDDEGGVHTQSNIHNRAAYLVLTTTKNKKKLVFDPEEVAVLYFLALERLPRLASFKKALQVLVDVAKSHYPERSERERKIKAILAAYQKVGITVKA